MSHNLEQRDGQTSMFYTGDVPWHQLGRRLDKPANAAEAMEAARLDYTVVKKPLKAIIHGRHYVYVLQTRRSLSAFNVFSIGRC